MSDQTHVTKCPHCLKDVFHWMPASPLYSLSDAMFYLMVPTIGAMRTAIWRYRHLLSPPRYAYDHQHRKYRMLTAEDIRTLRDVKCVSVQGMSAWMAISR